MSLTRANLRFPPTWDFAYKHAKVQIELPVTRGIVGDRWVDAHGLRQAEVIMSALQYRPRPIPQSYVVFNRSLAAENVRWLDSRHPIDVLMRLETIDGRFPALDDPLALAYLMHGYRFRDQESDFLLLERYPFPLGNSADTRTTHIGLPFGTWFALTPDPKREVYLRVQCEFTLPGNAARPFVDSSAIEMEVKTDAGGSENYRVPLGMAESGFLIHPLLRSNADVRNWLENAPACESVRAVRFSKRTAKFLFKPVIGLTIISWSRSGGFPAELMR